MDRKLEGVGATSLLTAAARALETERRDGLLSDPLARALAGTEGFDLLERGAMGPLTPDGSPLYVVRHRFLDDLLLDITKTSDIRQIVLLAAGLDTRAFRLDWPPGTRLLEVDQPSLFAYKEAILDEHDAVPTCHRAVVATDLREDWPTALRSHGFDLDRATAWVAEGLLFYLPEDAVHRLLEHTYRLSADGSVLAADMIGVSPGPPQAFKDLFAELGAPFIFVTADLAGLMRLHGWHADEVGLGEVARRLGTETEATGRIAVARRR